MSAPPPALVVSAPASGAGKTLTTLGLLRAFRDAGVTAGGAKSGPDYIDPGFHHAASGRPSGNLDAWAMDAEQLRARAAAYGAGADLLLIEGAMGVLDGAADLARAQGSGSTADLAAALRAPVVLTLDISGQAQSAVMAALGLQAARPDLTLAGVILNRVGSPRHRRLAARALEAAGVAVLGAIPRTAQLATPSRHLGLTPAGERSDLEAFVAAAGRLIAAEVDLDAVRQAAAQPPPPAVAPRAVPPIGGRIAIAWDAAFAFVYPHVLQDWRAVGAELSFFSPLANEAPAADADAVFLPGGYPELHAPRLASADRFKAGLRAAAARGAAVYGECGGYMALGQWLRDADGTRWPMAGLLPVETSFSQKKLHLGYRRLRLTSAATTRLSGFVPHSFIKCTEFAAHEFHFSTVLSEGDADAVSLFDAWDAEGAPLPPLGLAHRGVFGSFAHLISPRLCVAASAAGQDTAPTDRAVKTRM